MEKNSDEWEKWCLLEASEKAPMPGDWGKISDFRQLLIIRALKPGRITNALQVLVLHPVFLHLISQIATINSTAVWSNYNNQGDNQLRTVKPACWPQHGECLLCVASGGQQHAPGLAYQQPLYGKQSLTACVASAELL